MTTNKAGLNSKQKETRATCRPATRQTASLTPDQLLIKLQNIYRLGKTDLPRR